MSTTDSTLGTCPYCETPVPAHRLLIEYETTDGPGIFADCPECRDVVTPT